MRAPARQCTQRVPFKTAVRSFSWQGMDWCGGQPGGDRGGALAAEDKWPLCATFGEVKGGKGREEAANKGCLCPPSTPALFNHYYSCNDLVLSRADFGSACVLDRFYVHT